MTEANRPTQPIRLYDLCGADPDLRFSPHCWKVRFALEHKGVPFETIPTPFTGVRDVATPDGEEPNKTLPVIIDGGHMVRDSFAIAAYLDETYPERPLFGDQGHGLARYVETASSRAVHPLITRMIVADIHDKLAPDDQAYFRESREKRFGRLEDYQTGVAALADEFATALAPVRAALSEGPWLGGASPLFADYVVAGSLMWMLTISGKVPLAADDPVANWFEAILDLHGGMARKAVRAA